MEIAYQLFEEEKLYIQKFIGDFSFNYYIKYIKEVVSKIDPDLVKKVLIDFRDVIIDENTNTFFEDMDRIEKIRSSINKKEKKRNNVILIFWVDKPIPTVIAHLFVKNSKELNYSYCSSEYQIAEFLKLPKHFYNLKNIIANLKYKF